jgi:hypothetical protein
MANMPPKSLQTGREKWMISQSENDKYTRLALTPQILAPGFRFQMVHQATPKTAARAANNEAKTRIRKVENEW